MRVLIIRFFILLGLIFPALASAGSVIEFYNTNLDNYFITADSSEAAAIDSGSAGSGWSRTGNTFKSGGSTPVCRFYGSQSPGPNSHFYTVDPGECAYLKQLQASTPATQKRWNFESLDFVSTPPTKGTCPSGTVPVYRAYNNGSTRGVDSNHRITSSLTAIQEVVTRGWSNEGVVMCAQSITSFMSSTYLADEIQMSGEAYRIAVARYNNTWSGGDWTLALMNIKENHVQTYLNTVIAYIQSEKDSGTMIDKTAISALFSLYQARDFAWASSLQPLSVTQNLAIQTSYFPKINAYYAIAIASLNAM